MPVEKPADAVDLIKKQQKELKALGLDQHIVDYVGTLPVIEGEIDLHDERQASGFSRIKVRVLVGHDIQLPSNTTQIATDKDATREIAALSDIFCEGLIRTIQTGGYILNPYLGETRYELFVRDLIDGSKVAERLGEAPIVTLVMTEGSIWKDGKHVLVPQPGTSYYTEIVLDTIVQKFHKGKHVTPTIIVAACNQEGRGIHADIKPPKATNLVYTNGLASRLQGGGEVVFKFSNRAQRALKVKS